MLLPTRARMLGDTIVNDPYLRGVMLEVRDAMFEGHRLGKTAMIFRFNDKDLDLDALKSKHDVLLEYLKTKRYRVKYFDNGHALKIRWA